MGAQFVTGTELGLHLCDWLGIDPSHVTAIELRTEVQGLAEVRVTSLASPNRDLAPRKEETQRYRLVPIETGDDE